VKKTKVGDSLYLELSYLSQLFLGCALRLWMMIAGQCDHLDILSIGLENYSNGLIRRLPTFISFRIKEYNVYIWGTVQAFSGHDFSFKVCNRDTGAIEGNLRFLSLGLEFIIDEGCHDSFLFNDNNENRKRYTISANVNELREDR